MTSHLPNQGESDPYDAGEESLRYFPGHATRPAFGMLFVFDSWANADHFLNERGERYDAEVWEVDVRGAERMEASYYQNPRSFWDGKPGAQAVPVPKGTLVCNTVTLRRRVA